MLEGFEGALQLIQQVWVELFSENYFWQLMVALVICISLIFWLIHKLTNRD